MLRTNIILLLFLALTVTATQRRRPPITGEYIEDRANHVFGCYCEWSGEGETAGREALLAWQIVDGEYNGTSLGGVRFALIVQGDRTLSRPGAIRKSILFIDDTVSPEQALAVENLVRRNYGELAGSLLHVERQPITFQRGRDSASFRLGVEGRVVMRAARLPEDALPGARDWYEPFVPMTESTLGTTLTESYTGPGFDHRWTRFDQGVSGYFGTFTLTPQ